MQLHIVGKCFPHNISWSVCWMLQSLQQTQHSHPPDDTRRPYKIINIQHRQQFDDMKMDAQMWKRQSHFSFAIFLTWHACKADTLCTSSYTQQTASTILSFVFFLSTFVGCMWNVVRLIRNIQNSPSITFDTNVLTSMLLVWAVVISSYFRESMVAVVFVRWLSLACHS